MSGGPLGGFPRLSPHADSSDIMTVERGVVA